MAAEIGLSGLLLDSPHSGSAVYTRNLARLLPQAAPDLHFRLFVRRPDSVPDGVTVQRIAVPGVRRRPRSSVAAQIEKLAWEEVVLPAAAAARGELVLHSLYFAVPAVTSCRVIVTIHDVIPLRLQGYRRSRQAALYAQLMARLAHRAAAIVTVSEHARDDIVRTLHIPPSRIHVTPEAADERFRPQRESPDERSHLREAYGLPERFVLYIGGAERRKGIDTLVRAWARVAREMRSRGVNLVIVASFPAPDPVYPDTPGLVRELGLEGDVVLVPSVREADKPALYRAALALAFPSTYEGFGLTPLEAMASGTPVVAARATSIPEVVGDAAVLLPPDDVAAWAETLLTLADSDAQRQELASAGLARAAQFSWRDTAEKTVDVYRAVLGR